MNEFDMSSHCECITYTLQLCIGSYNYDKGETVMSSAVKGCIDDYMLTPLGEKEMLARLERSRNHAKQGLLRDADDVISYMRKRYNLQGISHDKR